MNFLHHTLLTSGDNS